MTTKLEQAARQALEALEVSTDWDVGAKGKQLQSMKAITALREALDHFRDATKLIAEQAEQKQMAFLDITYGREPECYATPNAEDLPEGTYRLYAAPIEPVKQEPVAWLYDWEHDGEIVTGWVTQDFETTKFNNGHNVRPLYAAAQWRDIEEAVKAERQEISKTFWGAVNSCITTEELGIEFMNKFYPVHIFGHWLDENENGHHHRYAGRFGE